MLMGKEGTETSYVSNYRRDNITINKLYLKNIEILEGKKIIIPGEDIYAKYKKDLDSIVETKKMTTEEITRWRYNPKVMSYDLYGTTEYWSMLLQINEVFSATEFNMNPVKVFSSMLPIYISRILNLEKEIINENEADIEKIINKN